MELVTVSQIVIPEHMKTQVMIYIQYSINIQGNMMHSEITVY